MAFLESLPRIHRHLFRTKLRLKIPGRSFQVVFLPGSEMWEWTHKRNQKSWSQCLPRGPSALNNILASVPKCAKHKQHIPRWVMSLKGVTVRRGLYITSHWDLHSGIYKTQTSGLNLCSRQKRTGFLIIRVKSFPFCAEFPRLTSPPLAFPFFSKAQHFSLFFQNIIMFQQWSNRINCLP